MNNSDRVFKGMENRFNEALRKLPRVLGTEVVRYSEQRFREQGWDGQPWRRRKPGAKNDTGRATLVKTGRLRRSIRITKITADTVSVGSDVPYARIHNEGYNGPQNVRAHNRRIKYEAKYSDLATPVRGNKFKVRKVKGAYETKVKAFVRRMRMPQRKFLGDSPYLRRNLQRITIATFNNAFK